MKNKVLVLTAILVLSALFLHAQEKKKIQVKVLKSENGETIKLDTTLISEHGDIYFYSNGKVNKEKIDSILKSLDIEGDRDIKFISEELDDLDSDRVRHIWISTTDDAVFDKEKHVLIEMNDGGKIIETNNEFTILENDSLKVKKEYVYIVGDEEIYETEKDGKKVVISKSGYSKSMIWNEKDSDVRVITITDDVNVNVDGKASVKMITTSDDDNVAVSEILIKKAEGGCKIIEVIVDEDEFDDENKIVELEKASEETGEHVKIVKYKTDKGKFVVKAEILDCNLTKQDLQKAKEIGLEDKTLLVLKNIDVYPNPTQGVFTLKFEAEEKENTLIKVYNQSGKSIYSEKKKRFNGAYSNKIDISAEDDGVYFVKIIQGNKSITKKILKK